MLPFFFVLQRYDTTRRALCQAEFARISRKFASFSRTRENPRRNRLFFFLMYSFSIGGETTAIAERRKGGARMKGSKSREQKSEQSQSQNQNQNQDQTNTQNR